MKKSFLKIGCLVLAMCMMFALPVFGTEAEVLPAEKEFSRPVGGVRCEATTLSPQETEQPTEIELFAVGETLEETLLNGINNGEEIINVGYHMLTPEEFTSRYYDFCMLHPELLLDTSWEWEIILNRVTRIKPKFLAPAEELEEARTLLEEAINQQVENVRTRFQDPLEQLLFLHDWMAVYCEYDTEVVEKSSDEMTAEDALSFHAYGFFANKIAVCQAYSQVFYAIATKLGYEVSYCRNSGHVWNYIKLDGEWYHMDVTWDDPTPDQPNTAIHKYFLCSDTVMQNHSPEEWKTNLEELPPCNSTKYESGYMFNLLSRKTLVKKDGHYQFVFSGITFVSDRLWTGKVLTTAPQNRVIRYIYLEEPETPVSIYTARKDDQGVLRGGGASTRTGESMYNSDNTLILRSYTLPTGPASATLGTIYFRDAATQKPCGPTLSF